LPNYANITIIGHIGRDPETRTIPSGHQVTHFSVATSKRKGQEEETTWWRVSLWGKRGEVLAQYLSKGDPVLITGEPYMRTYTAQDGQERQSMEIDARDFAFIGGKEQQSQPRTALAPKQDFDDDVPF
jgi:single-strand DNA-binding protein